MRKFIIHILLFLLSLFIVSYIIHCYTTNLPNDYTYKKKCLETNASSVKILCLGNSQTLYGINPDFFTLKGFNLAFVSQTYDIDNFLFTKYIDKLDSLKYLILQASYTSFFETLGYETDSWRINNYERYFSIYPPFDKTKIFINLITTERNNLHKLENLIKGKKLIYCNDKGFDESYTYENRNTNLLESSIRTAERHTVNSFHFSTSNKKNVLDIIEKARKKDITIILYIPPVHRLYQERLNKEQLNRMYNNIHDILENNNKTIYLDWSQENDFHDDDFYDCDHLNNSGAKRLTLKLDSVITKNLFYTFEN